MLSSRDSCHQMELRLDVRSWIRFCCHNTTSPPQQASVFDNLLLSPRAFKHQGLSPAQIAAVSPQIPICRTCLGSLKREKPKPPKLSIANGFYIGELPESLRTASRWTSKSAAARTTVEISAMSSTLTKLLAYGAR